ncbi:hypothetical protein MRY82_00900 [bacterium]|nr:hypothetical protein [bacterium]
MAEKHRRLHIPRNTFNSRQFFQSRAFYGSAFVLGFFSMEMIRFFNSPYTRFEDCMHLLEIMPELTKRYITFNIGFYSSQAIYSVIARSLTQKLITQNSSLLFNALSKHVQLSAAATKIWGKAFLRTTVSYAVGLMLNAMLYNRENRQSDYWQQMFEYTGSVLVANAATAPFFLKARHYVKEMKYLRYVKPLARTAKAGFNAGKHIAKTNFFTLFAIGMVEVVLVWDTIPAFFQDLRNAGKVEGALGWEMARADALLKNREKMPKFPRRNQVVCQQSLSQLHFYTCVQQRLLADVKHYLLRRSLQQEIKDLKQLQYIESVYDTNNNYAEFIGRMGDDFKVINPFKVDRGYIPWEHYKKDMHILMERYQEYHTEFRKKYQNELNTWMQEVNATLKEVHSINMNMISMIFNAEHSEQNVAQVLQSYEQMAQDKSDLMFDEVYKKSSYGRNFSNDRPRDHSLGALLSGRFGEKKQNYHKDRTLSGKDFVERLLEVANNKLWLRDLNRMPNLKPGELFKAYAYFLYDQEQQLRKKLEQNLPDDECEKLQAMLAQLSAIKVEFEVLLSGWFNEIELPDNRSFKPASVHLGQPVAVYSGGVFNESGYPGLEAMFADVRGDNYVGDIFSEAESYFSELSKKSWPGLFEYGVESLEDLTHKFSTFSNNLSSRSVTLQMYGDISDAARIQKARVLKALAARSSNVLFEKDYDLDKQEVWDQVGLHIWDLLWINRNSLNKKNHASVTAQQDSVYQKITTYDNETSPCRMVWRGQYEKYKHFFYDEFKEGLTYLGFQCTWKGCQQEEISNIINPEESVAWKIYDNSAISFQLFKKRADQSLGISPQYDAQGNLALSSTAFQSMLVRFKGMMNNFEQRYCMQ